LNHATPEQIYAAMLPGPSAMPTFSDRSLTPGEKKDIIAYLLSVRGQRNSLAVTTSAISAHQQRA